MKKIKKFVIDNNVDVIGLADINKDWKQVEYENIICGATSGWEKNRQIQILQNTTRAAENEYLVGGTAMIAFDHGFFSYIIRRQTSEDWLNGPSSC